MILSEGLYLQRGDVVGCCCCYSWLGEIPLIFAEFLQNPISWFTMRSWAEITRGGQIISIDFISHQRSGRRRRRKREKTVLIILYHRTIIQWMTTRKYRISKLTKGMKLGMRRMIRSGRGWYGGWRRRRRGRRRRMARNSSNGESREQKVLLTEKTTKEGKRNRARMSRRGERRRGRQSRRGSRGRRGRSWRGHQTKNAKL